MPPTFSARCWAALCGKYPELSAHGTIEPEMIISGSMQGWANLNRTVKPDAVNGIPPRMEEVTQYFLELQSTVNPADFMDHYDSVGWVIGGSKNRMKDWRAACRLWHRRQQVSPRAQPHAGQGSASLFALQAQLKTIETELEGILYPGGAQFKTTPTGGNLTRYTKLMDQRRGIKARIDAFGIG